MGEACSVLVEHDGQTVLMQGSAGFRAGALNERKADVVALGIGGLAGTEVSHPERYWKQVVPAVSARRIVPIHWDNFFRSREVPLVPSPAFERAMDGLLVRAAIQAAKHGRGRGKVCNMRRARPT